MKHRRMRLPLFIILCGSFIPATQALNGSAESRTEMMLPDRFGSARLEQRILHYTNQARIQEGLDILTFNDTLRTTARKHSREMAALHYLSHTSPIKGRESLKKRVEEDDLRLYNMLIGENIGVDFFLRIADIPYYIEQQDQKTVYIEAETGRMIGYQYYNEFAQKMVRAWLDSPDHRRNLLNPTYREIGIGAAPGPYTDLEAVYVTQVFKGPLRPEDIEKYKHDS